MWTQAVWRIEYNIVVLVLVLVALSALICKKKLGHYLYVFSFSLNFLIALTLAFAHFSKRMRLLPVSSASSSERKLRKRPPWWRRPVQRLWPEAVCVTSHAELRNGAAGLTAGLLTDFSPVPWLALGPDVSSSHYLPQAFSRGFPSQCSAPPSTQLCGPISSHQPIVIA